MMKIYYPNGESTDRELVYNSESSTKENTPI